MQKLSLILAVIILIIISSFHSFSQVWTKIETEFNYFNKIICPEGKPGIIILAADAIQTDYSAIKIGFNNFGQGYKVSLDSGKTWSETKLDQYTVLDLQEDSDNPSKWYASMAQLQRGGILISNDAGNTWDTENIKCDATYQIIDLYANANYNANYKDTYFAAAVNTSEGFITSDNNFESCKGDKSFSVSARDFSISKINPSIMFLACDGFYENGVFRSLDSGKTWLKWESGLEGKRVHAVLSSSEHIEYVIAGVDSVDQFKKVHGKGIYRSIDTGKTWQFMGADGAIVYELAEHPANPKFIAAACGKLGVFVSANHGAWWEQYNDGLPQENLNVTRIAIPDWDWNTDGFYVLAGANGNGLYKSKRLVTDIPDSKTEQELVRIYPNPAEEFIYVDYYDNAIIADFSFINSYGEEVLKMDNIAETSTINISNLAPGLYLAIINIDGNRIVRKIIVN